MTIGQGSVGLLSNVRTFSDLLQDSAPDLRITVEAKPKELVAGWALDSGSVYKVTLSFVEDNVIRDVVKVQTLLDNGLSRVEDRTAVAAGTYFYNPDTLVLYIQLTDSSNPTATSVAVSFGYYFGTKGDTHPTLGRDKLTNGDFETWASSSDAGTWAETGSSGVTFVKETSIVKKGLYSGRISLSGSVANQSGDYSQSVQHYANFRYRFSGYYNTGPNNTPNCTAGIVTANTAVQALAQTHGRWRRFVCDFYAPSTGSLATKVTALMTDNSVGSGYVVFDQVKLQPIYRFECYEQLVDRTTVPSSNAAAGDVFWGSQSVTTGKISIHNNPVAPGSSSRWDRVTEQLEWLNADITVKVGGAFHDGAEMSFDDYSTIVSGYISNVDVSDSLMTLDLQDIRSFIYVDLVAPLGAAVAGAPAKVPPIWFGTAMHMIPTVQSTATSGGPDGETIPSTYKLADCSKAPNGIKALTSLYSYANADFAKVQRAARRVLLTLTTDYTVDLATSIITLVTDVRIIQITGKNRNVQWSDGGAQTINLTTGVYTPRTLAAHIQTQMRSIGGASADISCSYNNTTRVFTISKTAGTLQLLINSGGNKNRHVYQTIGYTSTADSTGALSYTAGSEATFESDPEVLRADAIGFKDDASGTYTGTASAAISLGPDIVRTLVPLYLGQPSFSIDVASFANARTRAPQPLLVLPTDDVSIKNLFEGIQASTNAIITSDADGVVYYNVYSADLPAETPALYDYDFVSYVAHKQLDDVYKTVTVFEAPDPQTGLVNSKSFTDSSAQAKFKADRTKEFNSYLTADADATTAATKLSHLSTETPKHIEIEVNNRLMGVRIGVKVQVTRTRGMNATGSFSSDLFHVKSFTTAPLTGRTHAVLVAHVVDAEVA